MQEGGQENEAFLRHQAKRSSTIAPGTGGRSGEASNDPDELVEMEGRGEQDEVGVREHPVLGVPSGAVYTSWGRRARRTCLERCMKRSFHEKEKKLASAVDRVRGRRPFPAGRSCLAHI